MTTSVPSLSNFINNDFVSSSSTFVKPNPATSQPLCLVPKSGQQEIDDAVKAAKQAQPAWEALGYEARAAFLDKIADGISARAAEFARVESEDSGKPLSLASRIDVPRAVANFRFFAGAIRHDQTECHSMADALNYTLRSAVGVAGLITPWNLPIYLLSWKVAPALAMGNTVVAKPSEITPRTASLLAEVCRDVNLPPGVLNVVHGLGAEAGQRLVEHPDVPLISFTGGTLTGRRVAATAAPMFKKYSLELGGKNATVVFDDCDFIPTVKGTVRAAFTNQGQVCLAGSRVFVQAGIYDKFLSALIEETRNLKCGDPSTSDFGALSSLDHRAKVESYVKLARDSGARIEIGGERPALPPPFDQGAFFQPTIISNLAPSHACSREEIFGPIITVHKFHTEDEVIDEINAVRYGLAGSLWTNDLTRVHRITRRWQTGMLWVNTWLLRDLRVPFGGIKESGVGTEGGRHSLEFYSHMKNVCIQHGPSKL